MTEVEKGACDGLVPGYSAHRPGPTRGQDCHLCHQVFQQGKHIIKGTVNRFYIESHHGSETQFSVKVFIFPCLWPLRFLWCNGQQAVSTPYWWTILNSAVIPCNRHEHSG